MARDGEPSENRHPVDRDRTARTKNRDDWAALLSLDEERELAARIKAGDQTARKLLILANLRLVVAIAKRYPNPKVPLDDLIQEGNLGLIRASADFDPAIHGCRFYTYAEVWIKAFIHRTLIANDSLIRVPRHVFLERRRSHNNRTMNAYEGTADEVGSPASEWPVEGTERGSRSLDPGEADVVPLTDAIVDNHPPDQQATDHERRLLLEAALRGLNPVEAWVIRERYGVSSPVPNAWSRHGANGREPAPKSGYRPYYHRTYVELSRDCGLSRHRILQVEAAAIGKLRDVLGRFLAPTP